MRRLKGADTGRVHRARPSTRHRGRHRRPALNDASADCLQVTFWLPEISGEIKKAEKFGFLEHTRGKTHKQAPQDVTVGSAHHLCLSGGLRPLWGLPLSLTYLIRPLKLINMNGGRGQLKAFLRKEGRREREGWGDFRRKGVLCLWTMS